MRACVGAAYNRQMTTVTVTDLILNFADACRRLVPVLDYAGVPWGDGDQYDNWDRIAEALFTSLVTEPCTFQALGKTEPRVVRYGFTPDADCTAWIAVEGECVAQFINLSSLATPFDHVQCAEPVGLVPLEGKRFAFVYVTGDGPQRLERVDLATG